MFDPWSEINPSDNEGDHRIRRADTSHPLDWFRGRDVQGNYLLILYGTAAHELPPVPNIAAFDVILQHLASSKTQLVLTLRERGKFDIFRVLCGDLMNATRKHNQAESGAAFIAVLNRLRRWQQMLDHAAVNLLTRQEQIGLFGELLFLRDFMGASIGIPNATMTWEGPEGDEQDFQFRGTALEVKTRLVSSDSSVSVSSINQLDPSRGPIILCCQSLGLATGEINGGQSLNSLVNQIAESLAGGDGQASDRFESNLLLSGFERRPEYDALSWVLSNREFFSVEAEFPSLRAGSVPDGVSKVRYQLSLAACAPFKISIQEANSRTFA